MENNVLQKFLDVGMLDIGEQDEKFKHLQNASQDLAKSLSERRLQIINYTLVALDPNIPPDEPVLLNVESAIKEHWKTYKNRFPDVAKQLLRAVILEALHQAGAKDGAIASIIWLTGGSFLPFADLGRERAICAELLMAMGDMAEAKGTEAWSGSHGSSKPAFPSLAAKWPKIEKSAVEVGELTEYLIAASGPHGKDSQPRKNPNPHWSNSAPHWSYEFAPRAAAGIASVIDSSNTTILSSVSKTLKHLDGELTNFSSAIDAAIQQTVHDVIRGVIANERRNLLLWWKQTLYSPSVKRSYRALKQPAAAIVMAYDLHRQVPEYCPQSVEYLLRETVGGIIIGQETPSFMNICDAARSDGDLSEWKKSLGHENPGSGRTSMLSFMEKILAGAVIEPKSIQRMVGIQATSSVSLEDLSVWLFRDLQARRLASSKG